MMKRLLIYLIVCGSLLCGCRQDSAPSAVANTPTPTPTPRIDAKTAFASPEGMTKFLEQRWPLEAIKTFCIPERRHNNMYQNLVAGFDGPVVWKGKLYQGIETGFDDISWYANSKNGRATTYSLNVERGDDFWLLEIGDEEYVEKTPPNYSPDPSGPWFVGHK